jgi:hypothetical protein
MDEQTAQTKKALNCGWKKKKQPQPLTYSSMDEKSIIPTYKEVNYGWANNQAQLMTHSMVDEYKTKPN